MLMFELDNEPAFQTHDNDELLQYQIDFAVDFSDE